MDKAVWVGSEQARSAALQQFFELKDDSETILAAVIVIGIGIFIGCWLGDRENANRKGK
jgi:hypothetical protein